MQSARLDYFMQWCYITFYILLKSCYSSSLKCFTLGRTADTIFLNWSVTFTSAVWTHVVQIPPPKDRSPSQRPFCTLSWWGVNSQVGECLVGLCHQGWRLLAEEPPRALREVERLTRNPEKLANADGRCWKDTLGRKRSFKTHRPLYPTRRGLVTAWQETKKLLHDESGRTMSGRTWRGKISQNCQDW